ncbi:YtxH domain-containing protein [Niallia sp.]|uniref:YtxH domain-containing protein n=1 Tax=Niallia sp. TaxID=2837523 RepID=UPI0028981581|nr:YtxH domain-containing protein [Niallia sp.]
MSISKGLFIGSLIGTAISLLDKQTRQNAVTNIQHAKDTVTDFDQMSSSLNRTAEKIKKSALKISDDAAFVKKQLEELKGITPVVATIIHDTKEAFFNGDTKNQERKLVSSIHYLPETESSIR